MSHRIIEKRRRDRMNNCLADLSRLIPSNYLKKGTGRIEKTEIIEMAIKHLKYLKAQTKNLENNESSMDTISKTNTSALMEQFCLGFHDCNTEVMRFLVEVEGYYAGEGLCIRLMNHLQAYCEKISKSRILPNEEKSDIPGCMSDVSQDTYMSSSNLASEPPLVSNSIISVNGNSSSSQQDNCSMDVQLGDCKSLRQQTSDYESEIGSSKCHTGSPDGSGSSNSSISDQSLYESNEIHLHEILQNAGTYSEQIQRQISSQTEAVYKFKTNIKKRFKADLQSNKMDRADLQEEHKVVHCSIDLSNIDILSPRPQEESVKEICKQLITLETHSKETQNVTAACIQTPNSELPILKSGHETSSSLYVPIFALHSSGTYYIPLSITSSYLDSLVNWCTDINQGLPICHPVNIMVSFNNACKVPESNGWKGHNNLNSSAFTSSIVMATGNNPNKTVYGLPTLTLPLSKA